MQNDELLPATYDVEIAKTPTPDHPIPLDTQMYIKELESRFDMIVEQLETELKIADEEKQRCASENPMQFDTVKGYSTGISNALDIVKGGVDNAE